jgi:hypothetical protein
MRIGKYIVETGAGPEGTVYYLVNSETGRNMPGAWKHMTLAVLEGLRLER